MPSVSAGERHAPARGDWVVPALGILFFCSGVSALIYQVLWLRLLGLVFGVTIYAASTVWASFMTGLAVGSFGAGRLTDRVRHPLRWFGACEIAIGVTALSTPAALSWSQQMYMGVYSSLPQSIAALTIVRFLMAGAVLVVPTMLMGATLPLVIKSSLFRATHLGRRIGFLYAMNTTGAIAGALAAGLFLIPGRGIHGTFVIAALLNFAAGLSALLMAARLGRSPVGPAAAEDRGVEPVPPFAASNRTLALVLAVFAASGFTALGLEVVWVRVLTLFLRPTVYGFAVMLATLLAGIAIGSYVVTPHLDRRLRWIPIIAALEIAIGVAAVLSFGPLAQLSVLSQWLTPIVSALLPPYLAYPIAGSLLAIFPTAFLMGAAFPIGLRLWAGGGDAVRGVASRIGVFYGFNVLGSIVGSLLAGFVLLPLLGSRSSLILLGTVSFGSGVALLIASDLRRSTRAIAVVLAAIVFGGAVWQSPDPFDQFVAQRYPRQRIVWREEGVDSTVVVHEARNAELSLTVNGNHQASTGGGMVGIHRTIGHLPMALHPAPRTALVIGLGGGATAGAISVHDGVTVDVVELAQAVANGARYFAAVNHDVLSRPNAHLRIDDGRNYLMLTTSKYDVVTADVIHPIYAGSGNLYSAEYFQAIKRVLNPGGMVLQWVAGTDAEYKIIARTFLSVFPHTTVWADGTLLLGRVEPLELRPGDFGWKVDAPGHALGLRALGVSNFEGLLKLFRAGPDQLRAFVGPGPLLTDDRPVVEYFLSLPRGADVDLTELQSSVAPFVIP